MAGGIGPSNRRIALKESRIPAAISRGSIRRGQEVKCGAIRVAMTGAMVVALLAPLSQRTFAASDTASVTISIQIGPIAEIDFPQGTGFELYIPSREEGLAGRGPFPRGEEPHVDTAQIPFTVIGNAWVTVEAAPGAVLEPPPGGPVGRAFGDAPVGKAFPDDPDGPNQGVELPYRLWIEFPEGSSARSPAGLGNPSGRNPTEHSISRANVASGPVSGIVHVVPGVIWGEIASQHFDNPGRYRGEVQVTITATEK